MNIHKKITEIGFTQCDFMRPVWSGIDCLYIMVNDDKEYIYIDGKNTLVEKQHPKGDSFYHLKFSNSIDIYLYLKSHRVIKELWISGLDKNDFLSLKKASTPKSSGVISVRNVDQLYEGVISIYSYDKNHPVQINSVNDIISLFPKNIQRDFILNSVLNK